MLEFALLWLVPRGGHESEQDSWWATPSRNGPKLKIIMLPSFVCVFIANAGVSQADSSTCLNWKYQMRRVEHLP